MHRFHRSGGEKEPVGDEHSVLLEQRSVWGRIGEWIEVAERQEVAQLVQQDHSAVAPVRLGGAFLTRFVGGEDVPCDNRRF
mmetsp:Transcript_12933/g.12563  ORF Transcript_12933/g.12563 Transcript_12933/m.12563 type:complete len:81 (-) Transcript_12933:263-505(-)